MNKTTTIILTLFAIIFIAVLIGFPILLGWKSLVFFIGMFSTFMYITVTVSNISNALISRVDNPQVDLFWRYLFSFIATVCFTILIF